MTSHVTNTILIFLDLFLPKAIFSFLLIHFFAKLRLLINKKPKKQSSLIQFTWINGLIKHYLAEIGTKIRYELEAICQNEIQSLLNFTHFGISDFLFLKKTFYEGRSQLVY